MAESKEGQVSRLSNMLRVKEDGEDHAELRKGDIREVPINLTQKKRSDSPKQIHGCDICMVETVFTLSLYLCYECGVYLCEVCLKTHDKTHEFVKRKNRESKRRVKASSLVFGMRGENKVERRESIDRKSVKVIGRVNVTHDLDKADCYISGLSGLENKMGVAVDYGNNCIKIFSSVLNTLLRCIHFGSTPRAATEIKVQQNSIDLYPDSASVSKASISVTTRDEPDKYCLLAVTFPVIKQIWFIDVNKIPAIKTKTVQMNKACLSIDFSEDKIFTFCEQDVESESQYSIDILSLEGNQLKVVQIPGLFHPFFSDLAVYKGRAYLSVYHDKKVLCMNVADGKTFSQLAPESSRPKGISVDHDNGVVYLCGQGNKVYKLSPDLREYEPLSLDTDYIHRQYKLCFINNKLYISHIGPLCHVVTVVQVLT